MEQMLAQINAWVWDERLWIPDQFTWDEFTKNDIIRPQLCDLYVTPLVTVVLLCVRYVFERHVAQPFCKQLGIVETREQSEAHMFCEEVFKQSPQPSKALLTEVSMQTGWSLKKCSQWFTNRCKHSYSSLVKKSSECCWRCFAYLALFLYGSYVLVPSTYLWNIKLCFVGFISDQALTLDFKWYYILELAFYLSLLISQFYDTKRKDFLQLFLHHVITIYLITCSYIMGYFRIGSIIMWLHDFSDYWLEAAKVANYAKLQGICDSLFLVFGATFFVMRWVYFPFYVIYNWMLHSDSICGHMRSFITVPYICLGGCFILFGLHVYWGVLIAKMVYKFTVEGKVEKDERSDDEVMDESCEGNQSKNHSSKED